MRAVTAIIEATLLAIAALFPIVNPLGSSVIFLGLTRGYARPVRDTLVRAIAFDSFLLLVVSIIVGSHVLAFFGVSIPVVQVAGGLVVVAMGWTMLQQQPDQQSTPTALGPEDARKQAFYPLTLPVTVGPGSISVAVALGANSHMRLLGFTSRLSSALLAAFAIAISIFICYRSAERLERFLGETGLSVFTRLMAFIVLCIGIQILWNGYTALSHGLH